MFIEKLARQISTRNRKRKYDFFIKTFKPDERTKILDVGYTDNDYYGGLNFLEYHYPFQHNITALGIEEPKIFPQKFPKVKVVRYDGNIFPFKNKEFDIVWSNAVIEHVGNYEKQKFFVSELVRTGKKIFMTTPNRFFPFEVHTRLPLLHFLPKKYFDKIMIMIGKKWATGDYMYLLSENDLKRILRELGITNYTIKRNRFFLFTMDFSVIVQ